MTKTVEDYVEAVSGWQLEVVTALRRDILSSGLVEETLKWGQPVYNSNGPVCFIKAHKGHVSFGLWRGARLLELDERIEPAGGAEMGCIKLRKPGEMPAGQVQRLVAAGADLNKIHGDPMKKK
jgi:hypothetical protein